MADSSGLVQKFISGEKRIVVSSYGQLAGVDLGEADIVVNFDFPHSSEGYMHSVLCANQQHGRSMHRHRNPLVINLVSDEEMSAAKLLQGIATKRERLTGEIVSSPGEKRPLHIGKFRIKNI